MDILVHNGRGHSGRRRVAGRPAPTHSLLASSPFWTMPKTMLLLLFTLLMAKPIAGQFFDWSMGPGASSALSQQPTCVSIPANMSLCSLIGYTRMRLPNLLDHDTLTEVEQQAKSWVPLVNIRCHADARLFLCSLFAPVCLERPIYPCRSLCQKVKAGCEGVMHKYGFPWPTMLDCDKFPLDNDMCITSQVAKQQDRHVERVEQRADGHQQQRQGEQSNRTSESSSVCQSKSCPAKPEYEYILGQFCQADFAMKLRLKRGLIGGRKRLPTLIGRRSKRLFKTWPESEISAKLDSAARMLRRPRMQMGADDKCCVHDINQRSKKQRYLIMGHKKGQRLIATFVLPWNQSNQALRRARRMFRRIDCQSMVNELMEEAKNDEEKNDDDSNEMIGRTRSLRNRRLYRDFARFA